MLWTVGWKPCRLRWHLECVYRPEGLVVNYGWITEPHWSFSESKDVWTRSLRNLLVLCSFSSRRILKFQWPRKSRLSEVVWNRFLATPSWCSPHWWMIHNIERRSKLRSKLRCSLSFSWIATNISYDGAINMDVSLCCKTKNNVMHNYLQHPSINVVLP